MKKNETRPGRKTTTGIVGEARLQAHLGVMEAQAKVGPFVAEVAQTARETAGDVAKRARALKMHLKALKAAR